MRKVQYYLLVAVLFLTTNVFGQVSVSIPDTSIDVGQTIELPVRVSGLNGSTIEAYQMELSFDESVLAITGYSTSNTQSSSFILEDNAGQSGKYLISGASTAGLNEDGVLIYLNVEGTAEGSSNLSFENMLLNEGSPSVTTEDGTISVGDNSTTPDDIINVTLPDTALDVGQTLDVPIHLSELNDSNIEAFEMELSFDESLISINGYSSSGTQSSDFNLTENTSQDGKYLLSGASSEGINEGGVLIFLEVEGIEEGMTELIFEKMLLNEGGPEANTVDGSVTINTATDGEPDLVANSVSGPSSGVLGDSINVQFELSNIGEIASEVFNVSIYLSTNNIISDFDTEIGVAEINSGLAIDESLERNKNFEIPASLSAGDYYLGIVVDSDNEVEESSEGNNAEASTNTISITEPPAGEPDLVPISISGPEEAAAGETIDVEIEIGNEGDAEAASFDVQVYISDNSTITVQDTEIGEFELTSGIAAGDNIELSETFTIPSSISPDEYYFGIRVDGEDEISESDEDNNTMAASASIIITDPPSGVADLVANSISVGSSEVSINDSLDVEIEISNEGATPIESYGVEIYLSKNTTITSNDILLDEFSIEETINVDSEKDIQRKVLISSVDLGEYYLGLIIDPGSSIEEENKNNNIATSEKIKIDEEKYIDLVADDIRRTGSFAYQVTASNIGNSDASGNFQIGVFLSKDDEADENDLPITIHEGNYTIEAGGELEFNLEATEDTTEVEGGEYLMWFAINLEGSEEENIDNNIFMSTDAVIVSNEEIYPLPKEFNLHQNYPNPFNPTTQIQYQLPKPALVSFGVFDMTGREVYSFDNQQKSAGEHTIQFDATNLSSGIYIYQINAGGYIKTKKMTLIK